MIVILRNDITPPQREELEAELVRLGVTLHPISGKSRSVIALVGDTASIDENHIRAIDGVASTVRIQSKHKLVSLETQPEPSQVEIGAHKIKVGCGHFAICAGPCSVESLDKLLFDAEQIQKIGVPLLRGGAFKPRTNPYDFQGLMEKGLEYLAAAREKTGLAVVTEVMTVHHVDLVAQYADVMQIGTRNMQNFHLLEAVGKTGKPVLLKRGMSSTFTEWMFAAEYIMKQGNRNVILCERGIRTFEDHVRNTLTLASVPAVHTHSHLPIMVDPSHGTGNVRYVKPMANAAIAAGADGLLIEATGNPSKALTDGAQTVNFNILKQIVEDVQKIADVFHVKLERADW